MGVLQSGLLQRALLEVVVLGLACGPLGVWVLHYRHVYAAESLAHALLPGLVVAAAIGAPLALGATGGVLLAAGLIVLAARDARVGGELAVAVTVAALFGAGAALALVPSVPARLTELLFGDPLAAAPGDVALAATLGVAVLGALAAGVRSLRAAGFDPVAAPSLGVRPARVELGLLVVLGVAIVAAVQALGNLLVLALVVAPAAAAIRASDRLGTQLRLAAALGAGAGVAGLELSYRLGVAAGPAIALAACAAYLIVALGGRPAGSGRAGGPGPPPLDRLTRSG